MFKNVSYSLADMLGKEYVESVIEANCFFGGQRETLKPYAYDKVPFYPEEDQKKNDALLEKVGTQVVSTYPSANVGAPTDSYRKAFNLITRTLERELVRTANGIGEAGRI